MQDNNKENPSKLDIIEKNLDRQRKQKYPKTDKNRACLGLIYHTEINDVDDIKLNLPGSALPPLPESLHALRQPP